MVGGSYDSLRKKSRHCLLLAGWVDGVLAECQLVKGRWWLAGGGSGSVFQLAVTMVVVPCMCFLRFDKTTDVAHFSWCCSLGCSCMVVHYCF